MITPQQKDELIKAVREYGEAEHQWVKILHEEGAMYASVKPVTDAFTKVIDIIHRL